MAAETAFQPDAFQNDAFQVGITVGQDAHNPSYPTRFFTNVGTGVLDRDIQVEGAQAALDDQVGGGKNSRSGQVGGGRKTRSGQTGGAGRRRFGGWRPSP